MTQLGVIGPGYDWFNTLIVNWTRTNTLQLNLNKKMHLKVSTTSFAP